MPRHMTNEILLERFLLLIEAAARGQDITLRSIMSLWDLRKTAVTYSVDKMVSMRWISKTAGGQIIVPTLENLLSYLAMVLEDTMSIQVTFFSETGTCTINRYFTYVGYEPETITAPTFVDVAMLFIRKWERRIFEYKIDYFLGDIDDQKEVRPETTYV